MTSARTDSPTRYLAPVLPRVAVPLRRDLAVALLAVALGSPFAVAAAAAVHAVLAGLEVPAPPTPPSQLVPAAVAPSTTAHPFRLRTVPPVVVARPLSRPRSTLSASQPVPSTSVTPSAATGTVGPSSSTQPSTTVTATLRER